MALIKVFNLINSLLEYLLSLRSSFGLHDGEPQTLDIVMFCLNFGYRR